MRRVSLTTPRFATTIKHTVFFLTYYRGGGGAKDSVCTGGICVIDLWITETLGV